VLDEPAAARHLAERSIHHWQPDNQCRNAGRRGAGLIRRTGICRTRPDSAQLYEPHGLRHTASVQPIKSTAEMMQDQTDSRGGFYRTRHWTLERRFKYGARSDDKGPDENRRAPAVAPTARTESVRAESCSRCSRCLMCALQEKSSDSVTNRLEWIVESTYSGSQESHSADSVSRDGPIPLGSH